MRPPDPARAAEMVARWEQHLKSETPWIREYWSGKPLASAEERLDRLAAVIGDDGLVMPEGGS